ncbi:MAG: methyltransferase domain-containing protein [Acetobacteraceae bacterium]|nr:methyltransferase domain-containing protein [Acetobacteraceae bacterium]
MLGSTRTTDRRPPAGATPRKVTMRTEYPGGAMTESRRYDTAKACRLLWRAYETSSLAQRALAAVRPLIARFDRVIGHIPPGAHLFDIGCGNGMLLALADCYAASGPGVGVDTNMAAIAAAREMAAARSLPLIFRVSETPPDWPVETFGAVTMIDVLHHVPAPLRKGLIEAALERVEPGGLFIYKDMCRRPVFRRLWNQLHDLLLARQLVVVEPIEHVIGWVSRAGFAPVASERYVGAGVYGHELEVFRRPAAA